MNDVTNLIESQYLGFGPTLAHEKLTEIHKLKILLSTVRKLMILKGLWKPDKIKKSRLKLDQRQNNSTLQQTSYQIIHLFLTLTNIIDQSNQLISSIFFSAKNEKSLLISESEKS